MKASGQSSHQEANQVEESPREGHPQEARHTPCDPSEDAKRFDIPGLCQRLQTAGAEDSPFMLGQALPTVEAYARGAAPGGTALVVRETALSCDAHGA